MGKSTKNIGFSIAMFDYQRVSTIVVNGFFLNVWRVEC